ncbi:MAG TPA: ABC transporter ATP-binding protein, partial [Chloroflexi bacterium]|nr:ABC transporter ATP-binding protein [Chloroflexota bacterium]
MAPAIEFEGVSKRFILQHDRPGSFQELFLRFFSGERFSREEFWALKNITFSVEPGEMLGIIGENGAGKSTILKIVAGILDPTLGRVEVGGKVSALLELGAGFHPDLTGRENIYFYGSILGLSKRQMDARFQDIVDFSGLEKFLDIPVRHYSSGMYIRLGFAVSTSIDPGGILAVDEVLAVGDAAFQKQCLERIEQLRKKGTTILFVSHALGLVRRLCDRALWLSKG